MPGLIMSSLPPELNHRHDQPFPDTTTSRHTNSSSSFSANSLRQQLFNAPTMTVSASAHGVSAGNGPMHGGGASNAMMSASSGGRAMRPVERLRLRDWLIRMVETKAIPGLEWIDKERQIVKIPWKHAARHGWSRDKDACLFRAWAIHTKKYDPSEDSPKANPKVWKANFRCAINSLPDIEEQREKGKSRGNDAYKVYRLHPRKTKRPNTSDGPKPTRRPRSTSKSRPSKSERRQRKRSSAASQNPSRASDHCDVGRLSSDSMTSGNEMLKKRIRADFLSGEPDKREQMSVNVHYVYKPNGLSNDCTTTTTTSASAQFPSPSPPSMHSPPSTPFHMGMHPPDFHFMASSSSSSSSSNPYTTTASHVSSTASTPQSPPPPYRIAVSQRQGAGYMVDMQARVEFNPHLTTVTSHHGYGVYDEDLSDSDSNMTEAEVAQMVLDIKDQSPGNSPRCGSPLDGNNNAEPAGSLGLQNDHWTQKQLEEKAFFGHNFEMIAQCNKPLPTKSPVYPGVYGSGLMTCPQVKLEPETYSSDMDPNHMAHLQYAHVSLNGAGQLEDGFENQSPYILHNL